MQRKHSSRLQPPLLLLRAAAVALLPLLLLSAGGDVLSGILFRSHRSPAVAVITGVDAFFGGGGGGQQQQFFFHTTGGGGHHHHHHHHRNSNRRGGTAAAAEEGIDYYAALELTVPPESEGGRSAVAEADIKRAYRRLSRLLHPDVAPGEAEKKRFNDINRAYEVLSDRKKRRMYDIRGEEGLRLLREAEERGGAGAGGGMNPFASMFGMRVDDGLRARDMELEVLVPLSTLFSGGRENFTYTKQSLCRHCRGSGAAPGTPLVPCRQCQGRGAVVQRVQLAPGMVQQVQQPCPRCHGRGEAPATPCPHCGGRRVIPHSHVTLPLEVEAGAPAGHEVIYELEGEEAPDRLPGNLRVRLQAQPHPVFSRRRNQRDLDAAVTITLAEALLGFRREMRHLDGSAFTVANASAVTREGDVIRLEGLGMPRLHVPSERGDLFLRVHVRLPRRLSPEQRALAARLLPP